MKTTLDERDTELFAAIKQNKDYVVVGKLYRNGYYKDDPRRLEVLFQNKRWFQQYRDENIENWRSKKTLKRKAVAAAPAVPIAPPAQKRKKVHECSKCDGNSDEIRGTCALDQGLPVYEYM